MVATNPTIKLLSARTSTRAFTEQPLTLQEREVILESAMRAPTAGNMMLYSIIEIADQAIKERLAVTCDDQPFIAKAPWVLMFVADYQKWIDLFDHGGVESMECTHRQTLGMGDFMLAFSDALIAAQNAVIAAESLGIGSCYIGDVIEQGEVHQELLDLPTHVVPVAMLVFGRPKTPRLPTPRQTKHVAMRDRYRRLTPSELEEVSEDLARHFAPHGFKQGIANVPQDVYRRKFVSDYMAEMNRSAAWWLERWQRRFDTLG